MRKRVTYADAGVNISVADEILALMRKHIESTYSPCVLSKIGTFGGLYGSGGGRALVASVDGVGTKAQVAIKANCHGTIGQDLVNHCLNDLVVQGPVRPWFFMDYIGSDKLLPEVHEQLVSGMCQALNSHGILRIPLLSGETAEMPGTYCQGQYDLVGMIVGEIEIKRVLNGSKIRNGDLLYGLPSGGLGTNGYSLARKVIFEVMGLEIDSELYYEATGDPVSVVDELLRVHRCYFDSVFSLMEQNLVKAAAHITGGGIGGNLIRVLPQGATAYLDRTVWDRYVPKVFDIIRKNSCQGWADYFKTFNDGIQMILVVSPKNADAVDCVLKQYGVQAGPIGYIDRPVGGKSRSVLLRRRGCKHFMTLAYKS